MTLGRLEAERRYEEKCLEAVRQQGILAPGEEVRGMLTSWRYSQLIMLLGWLSRLFQRRYLLVLTQRRAVLIQVPACLVSFGTPRYPHVVVALPCTLRLENPPKKTHQVGNRLHLPEPMAKFVRRPFGLVLSGHIAAGICQEAAIG